MYYFILMFGTEGVCVFHMGTVIITGGDSRCQGGVIGEGPCVVPQRGRMKIQHPWDRKGNWSRK